MTVLNLMQVKQSINDANRLDQDKATQLQRMPLHELKRRRDNAHWALKAQQGTVDYLRTILADLERAKELLKLEEEGLQIWKQREGLLQLLVLQREMEE